MHWPEFFLDIEPMSMRRIDPQQQQATAGMVLQIATTIAPLILQFPYMNWPEILDTIGDAYNIPDLARLIFNAQGLQLIQSGQLPGVMPGVNQQLQPPPAGSAPGVQMASAGAPIGAMPKPPTSQSRPALPGGAAGGMASGLAGAGAGTFGGPGAGR
jgi:hypothetical protein